MTTLVVAVTAAGLVLAVLAWLPRSGSTAQAVASTVMLTALLVAAVLVLAGQGVRGEAAHDVLLLVAGGLAVAGGGPLTTSVLALVDRGNPAAHSTQQAGEVLRGGALIGALERGAIFATLVAGWPDGLIIVVAIKGLARYPELRSQNRSEWVTQEAVAERFIIGTFTSVLWSVTCASLLLS